jgi:hypothetical protein
MPSQMTDLSAASLAGAVIGFVLGFVLALSMAIGQGKWRGLISRLLGAEAGGLLGNDGAVMSKRIGLLAVAVLLIFLGSGEAQQPVPSEKGAREEVARQKREWEERKLQKFQEDTEKVQRLLQTWEQHEKEWKLQILRQAIDTNDAEYSMLIARQIADRKPKHPPAFLFDGVQWERGREIRCPAGG